MITEAPGVESADAMTENKFKRKLSELKALFSEEGDGLKESPREATREVFEQEMPDTLGAGRG